MERYDISYEILNYSKYHKRLDDILNNPNNKFKVTKNDSIGTTSCGFDIDHYSIGNGPVHIVYMAGAHGNEIIGVDYVTQFMKNLALGNGAYANFDEDMFTIDFIPCQNPEGFYVTTYGLDFVMKNMNEEEIEAFSKKYWSAYRTDDQNVLNINKIIKDVCLDLNLDYDKTVKSFWNEFRSKDITIDDFAQYMSVCCGNDLTSVCTLKWQEKFKDKIFISKDKEHHKIFDGVTFDCIPEIDEPHINLKKSIIEMYTKNNFPMGTLCNFFSNGEGINLNDNNENFYNIVKSRIEKEGDVYANLRDNNLLKSVPGPVGIPASLDKKFEYANENLALLKFLEKNRNYAFMNCHGTGGMMFIYPVVEDDMEKAKTDGVTRNFNFYINNRISSDYVRKVGNVYKEKTGEYSPYRQMGYPSEVTGVGDFLRKTYLSSFILELSKMGGNPIAPYGDKNGNYMLTMESNMDASMQMLETVLEVMPLYDMMYEMSYDGDRVIYNETFKRK